VEDLLLRFGGHDISCPHCIKGGPSFAIDEKPTCVQFHRAIPRVADDPGKQALLIERISETVRLVPHRAIELHFFSTKVSMLKEKRSKQATAYDIIPGIIKKGSPTRGPGYRQKIDPTAAGPKLRKVAEATIDGLIVEGIFRERKILRDNLGFMQRLQEVVQNPGMRLAIVGTACDHYVDVPAIRLAAVVEKKDL
jgi:hypothetical protein